MTTPQLAIAKASFAASLLRPDPVSVSRDGVEEFFALLEAALQQCSSTNIQKCKLWLLKNVLQSSVRVAGLGKFLGALSGSFSERKVEQQQSVEITISSRRKRLHLLYLLNDVLHHTKYHDQGHLDLKNVSTNLQKGIEGIIDNVVFSDVAKYQKVHERFQGLLDLWAGNAYFEPTYLQRLREIYDNPNNGSTEVSENCMSGQRDKNDNKKVSLAAGRDAPYVIPASHGDPSTPFYDLPAGNMIRHIIPNRPEPINAKLMKPIQFAPGPADEGLANIVKDFLADTDEIFTNNVSDGKNLMADMDEMGQRVSYDDLTKERVDDTYYGWSRAFCENMKKRRLKGTEPRRERSLSYSMSSSRSHSRDPPLGRGRRYSDIRSHSDGRSRSRSNSASRSREHSSRYYKRENLNKGRRSISTDGSRSRSPLKHRSRRSYSRSRTLSRERSYSPMESIKTQSEMPNDSMRLPFNYQHQQYQQLQHPQQPLDPRTGLPVPNASSITPPMMNQFPSNLAMGLNGVPFPPPPPPASYNGIWPPPPPPLSGLNTNMNPATQAMPFQFGGLPPPPPPEQAVNLLAQFTGQNGGLRSFPGQISGQHRQPGEFGPYDERGR